VKGLIPRTETVLRHIVSKYIEKAVPVPSQSLVDDRELDVSSATIRNEMVRLEQGGYIIRPYASAGSVPTDKGYRFYVESLTDFSMPMDEQRLISHLFHQVERKLEEWLELAAMLVAKVACNISVVSRPKLTDCQFKHVQLVSIQDALVLVVLVLLGAKVKQQLVNFEQTLNQSELAEISNKLNNTYSGLTRSQILDKDIEFSQQEKQITDCMVSMMQAEDEREYDAPYLDGLHYIMNQPEFASSQRMAALMELVENRNLLRSIVPHGRNVEGVQVVIGKENNEEVIRDYSVVIGKYGLSGEVSGTIGVVGPTRMPYARTISAVGYISSVLSGLVSELYGIGQDMEARADETDA